MIEEAFQIRLVEVDGDNKLGSLFEGVATALPVQAQAKDVVNHAQNELQKPEGNPSNDWSQIDFKDEVYSERPLSKRRKIRKVENKVWKNLKKARNDTYIRMLQNKVQNLQKEILKQKVINKSNQDYIKKLSISEQIINGVFVGKSQIYDRLEALVEQPETEEVRKELVKEITTLRYRLGVQGKDRIKSLNYYFKEMVETFIPQCQKFLIFAACKSLDFFSDDYVDRGVIRYSKDQYWREQIIKVLNLTYQQRSTISSFKPTIIKQKETYDELVHKFYSAKKELTQQAKKLQIVFDNFRSYLSPPQLAKILVNIEKNKYRKEMNLESIDTFWSYDFECNDATSCSHSLFTTASETWN